MTVFGKVTFGLALAGLLAGQSAFAAPSRASDPRLGTASTGKVVGFRQSAKVSRKNNDIAGLTLVLAFAAFVGGGIAIIAITDGNNDDDLPASP